MGISGSKFSGVCRNEAGRYRKDPSRKNPGPLRRANPRPRTNVNAIRTERIVFKGDASCGGLGASDAPAEGIGLGKDQCAFSGDVCGSRHGGNHLSLASSQPTESPGESAAQDALLHPGIAFGQFFVGGKTGKLGTGSRATRRTVVGLARAEDKVS